MTKASLEKFVDEQRVKGGIILSKLGADSKVLVETSRFVYGISPVLVGGEIRFLVETGAPSPQNEKYCVGIDSHCPLLKHNMEDWIGKGLRMILKYQNGITLLTGEVVAASVEGGGFKYELWQ